MGMIFASIDIGSNAGRLLFANVYEKKGSVIAEKATLLRIPLRLGIDVFEQGMITARRRKHLIDTLRAFKLLIDVYGPVSYIACATAAMREASNGKEILDEIQSSTGVRLKIIDGLEEARIISSANNQNMELVHDYSMYVDVGGGSTEITITRSKAFVASQSFQIGTIRSLYGSTPAGEWEAMETWLRERLNGITLVNFIGSGGNINKITKIYGDHFRNILSRSQLRKGVDELSCLTVDERIRKLALRPDRADVILPAGEIFQAIMEWTGIQTIVAPKIGLADGLVVKLYEDYISGRVSS